MRLSMSVQATCFHCQHNNVFEDKWAGRVMRCQKCGGILTLPKLDIVAPPPANLEDLAQELAPARQPAAVTLAAAAPGTSPWPPAAPAPAVGLAEAARVRVPLENPSKPALNGHQKDTPKGNGRSPVAADTQPRPQESSGGCALAITLCTLNGLVMFGITATALMLIKHSTRDTILGALQMPSLPDSGIKIAFGVAAFTFLLGAFYLCCAAFMQRGSAFARAVAWVAIFQTALTIATLIFITTRGHLNYTSLAAVAVSLLIVGATIDFSTRAGRRPRPEFTL